MKTQKVVINFLKKQKKIKEILYPYKPSSKNYKFGKNIIVVQMDYFQLLLKVKKNLQLLNLLILLNYLELVIAGEVLKV